MSEQIALAWALVDGQRVSASSMVGVDPEKRPAAVCPCCSEAVTWKAGTVVTPHVAHRPGSSCAVTNPETAAHWNAKYHVAQLFNDDGIVDVDERWLGFNITCRKCRHTSTFHWFARQYEELSCSRVEIETRVGTRRADVAFVDDCRCEGEEGYCRLGSHAKTDRSAVTAVIEIKHSHAVDQRKADEYARLGVYWIEIDARDALAWTSIRKPITPLTICDRTRDLFESSFCEECDDRRWAHESEARRRAAITKLYAQSDQELPKPWVVVAASVIGTRGPAVVAASVVGSSQPPRTWFIGECGWHEAIWIAIKRASARLRDVAPGQPATIFSKYVTARHQISALKYDNGLKDEVALQAVEAGHVLLHSLPDERLQRAFERTKAAAQAAPHEWPSESTRRAS